MKYFIFPSLSVSVLSLANFEESKVIAIEGARFFSVSNEGGATFSGREKGAGWGVSKFRPSIFHKLFLSSAAGGRNSDDADGADEGGVGGGGLVGGIKISSLSSS